MLTTFKATIYWLLLPNSSLNYDKRKNKNKLYTTEKVITKRLVVLATHVKAKNEKRNVFVITGHQNLSSGMNSYFVCILSAVV